MKPKIVVQNPKFRYYQSKLPTSVKGAIIDIHAASLTPDDTTYELQKLNAPISIMLRSNERPARQQNFFYVDQINSDFTRILLDPNTKFRVRSKPNGAAEWSEWTEFTTPDSAPGDAADMAAVSNIPFLLQLNPPEPTFSVTGSPTTFVMRGPGIVRFKTADAIGAVTWEVITTGANLSRITINGNQFSETVDDEYVMVALHPNTNYSTAESTILVSDESGTTYTITLLIDSRALVELEMTVPGDPIEYRVQVDTPVSHYIARMGDFVYTVFRAQDTYGKIVLRKMNIDDAFNAISWNGSPVHVGNDDTLMAVDQAIHDEPTIARVGSDLNVYFQRGSPPTCIPVASQGIKVMPRKIRQLIAGSTDPNDWIPTFASSATGACVTTTVATDLSGNPQCDDMQVVYDDSRDETHLVFENSSLFQNSSSFSAMGAGLSTGSDPGSTMAVWRMIKFNNELYAAGHYGISNGTVHGILKWSGSAWVSTSGGNGTLTGTGVFGLAELSGALYACGNFSSIDGVGSAGVAKFNGSTWQMISTSLSGGGVIAWVACTYNGAVYIAGSFANIGGIAAGGIAKYNGTSWASVSSGLGGGATIYALCVYNNELYAAGSFTSINGVSAVNIAKWNGTTWSAVATSGNNTIRALEVYNGALFAGGDFTSINGVSATGLAKYTVGGGWVAVSTGATDGVVYALVSDTRDNSLIVGGAFTQLDGGSYIRLARYSELNTNESTRFSVITTGGIDSRGVRSLLLFNDNLIVGGGFETADGVVMNSICQDLGTAELPRSGRGAPKGYMRVSGYAPAYHEGPYDLISARNGVPLTCPEPNSGGNTYSSYTSGQTFSVGSLILGREPSGGKMLYLLWSIRNTFEIADQVVGGRTVCSTSLGDAVRQWDYNMHVAKSPDGGRTWMDMFGGNIKDCSASNKIVIQHQMDGSQVRYHSGAEETAYLAGVGSSGYLAYLGDTFEHAEQAFAVDSRGYPCFLAIVYSGSGGLMSGANGSVLQAGHSVNHVYNQTIVACATCPATDCVTYEGTYGLWFVRWTGTNWEAQSIDTSHNYIFARPRMVIDKYDNVWVFVGYGNLHGTFNPIRYFLSTDFGDTWDGIESALPLSGLNNGDRLLTYLDVEDEDKMYMGYAASITSVLRKFVTRLQLTY